MAIQVDITNETIFATLLKNAPMECPDWDARTHGMHEPLLRKHHVNCLISDSRQQQYNDNLCLFGAVAVQLHGTTKHERSTFKIFNNFLEKLTNAPKKFQGVFMDNLPIFEEVIEKNIFIYDIDIDAEEFEAELARKSIGNNENTVKLLC